MVQVFDPTIFAYNSTVIDFPEFDDIKINYSCRDDSDEAAELWAKNKGDFLEACTNALTVKDKNGCTWVRLYIDEALSYKKKSLRRGRYSSERGDLYSWFQAEAFLRLDDRENHLADLYYYSEHFYSDKMGQIMGEMDISTEYQEEVKKYKNFWSSDDLWM